MAQNTVEDTKSAADKTEMSETSTRTIDKEDSRDDKENGDETTNPRFVKVESTSKKPKEESDKKEESDEKEKIDDNSTNIKKQPSIHETELGKKSEEEIDLEKDSSSEETVKTKTKENELEENCPAKTSNEKDERVNAFFSKEEERLSEILKVVHEDLDIKYFQKPASQSTSAKDSDKDTSDKGQDKIKEEIAAEEQDTTKSAISVTVQDAEEEKDSKESLEKSEETSEIGIVGPPTAVSELINEEELGGGDTADEKDHIAEWVEKSAKEKVSTSRSAKDGDNVAEKRKQRTNGSEVGTTKWKNDDAAPISSRQSQKIVSNIIKRSIKW